MSDPNVVLLSCGCLLTFEGDTIDYSPCKRDCPTNIELTKMAGL